VADSLSSLNRVLLRNIQLSKGTGTARSGGTKETCNDAHSEMVGKLMNELYGTGCEIRLHNDRYLLHKQKTLFGNVSVLHFQGKRVRHSPAIAITTLRDAIHHFRAFLETADVESKQLQATM